MRSQRHLPRAKWHLQTAQLGFPFARLAHPAILLNSFFLLIFVLDKEVLFWMFTLIQLRPFVAH
eukprot:6418076-Amphidinium_carterae.1